MSMLDLQSNLRIVLEQSHISISELARRTGRCREDVQRSLSARHVWRLDRLLEYADALHVEPEDLLRAASRDAFAGLAKRQRWDDRRSTRKERRRRLVGNDRYREVARILEGVPMENFWRDLDFQELHRAYPRIRPHLTRTRSLWDAILPLLAEPARRPS